MGRPLGSLSSKIREPIIQERKNDPYVTMTLIANKFGVSKQYVEQVLRHEGVRTRRILHTHPCLQCKEEVSLRKKFCNRKCQLKFYRIILTCDECGKTFERMRCDAILTLRTPRTPKAPIKLWFCNHKCQGKHIAKYRKVIP